MYYKFFSSLSQGAFLVSLLLLSTFLASGQQKSNIDSLTSLLTNAPEEKKFELLLELFVIYSGNDYEKALYYAEEAEKASFRTGDSLNVVKSGRMIANALTSMGRNEESIEVLNRILPVARRNKLERQVIYILNSLALSYTFRGSYDKALDYHFQSLLLREKEGDQSAVSVSLTNIGLVYYKLKDYDKSIEYYTRALNIKMSIGDQFALDRLYANMGLAFNQAKSYKRAIESFEESFKVCGDNCSDDIRKEVYSGLGAAYFSMQDYDIARENFLMSLSIAEKLGDTHYQYENLFYLSKIKIEQQDDIPGALQNLLKAKELAEKTDYVESLINVYKELYIVYSKREDFQNASFYQTKYIHLKDSIYSEQLISNLAQVQTKYEERKNIQTIADKEEALSRQRLLNVAIAIIAILAALLVFVLYRSNRVTKRVNKELSAAKTIIEAQNVELTKAKSGLEDEVDKQTQELKVANESLKRVNEELDNFIYKTSHDIRGPLASLKGICNVAIMDVKDTMALGYLNKLDETAIHLNSILTRLLIINQINHASLLSEQVDFESIVNDVILLEKKRGLPPRLKIEQEIQPNIQFSSDPALLRIILENLIDNAIKFYNDSVRVEPFVHIHIEQHEKSLNVTVRDNGIGVSEVDPDKIFHMFSRASERSGTGGIGLYLSKLATEKLGGTINFRTTVDRHTEFYAIFPNGNNA